MTTSGISGIVVDHEDHSLPGVTITATHTPSGTVYRGVTNADGYFRILGMRTGGPYEVVATFIGFEDAKVGGITLSLGETNSINIKMKETSFHLVKWSW